MTTATKHKTADRLTAEERHELPDSAFGIPETREFPLVDAEHVRAAEAYFRYAPDNKKAALARRILAKAAAYGVNVQSQVIRSWAEAKRRAERRNARRPEHERPGLRFPRPPPIRIPVRIPRTDEPHRAFPAQKTAAETDSAAAVVRTIPAGY